MPTSDKSPEQLLKFARAGDGPARGRLLDLYRNYLRLMARSLDTGALRSKLDADGVQRQTNGSSRGQRTFLDTLRKCWMRQRSSPMEHQPFGWHWNSLTACVRNPSDATTLKSARRFTNRPSSQVSGRKRHPVSSQPSTPNSG